jgi:protein involved in polysaccharide export with SLBB domain
MKADAARVAEEAAALRERALAESRASRPDAESRRAFEEQARAIELRMRSGEMLTPAGPDALVRPADVLTVRIADEPELPRTYTVGEDGTIRVPLLGKLRVEGLTAAQVRDEVARQLTTRNLKAAPSVTVTLLQVTRR